MPFKAFDLTGRTAVVIGGTTGIGRSLVEGLVEAGADVVASARRQEEVDATAKVIEAAGKKTLRVTCDVSDKSSIQKLHDEVLEELRQGGHPDQLRRPHQAHALAGGARGRVRRHHGHEPDGHPARLPGVRPLDDREALRAHHQHRLAVDVRGPVRGGRLRRQQGRGGLAHQVAGHRVGQARGQRQRHRPRRVPHRPQPEAARRDPARPGVQAAHAAWAASVRSRNWPAPPSTWPPTPPASSPARSSSSTAASSPAASTSSARGHDPRPRDRGGVVLALRAGARRRPAPRRRRTRPALDAIAGGRGGAGSGSRARRGRVDRCLACPPATLEQLPLESRTHPLLFVGDHVPGVVAVEGGLSIHGGEARETALFIDDARTSRLVLPLGMLERLSVLTAGYGAALADVTGGAVVATTRRETRRLSLDVGHAREMGRRSDDVTSAGRGHAAGPRSPVLAGGGRTAARALGRDAAIRTGSCPPHPIPPSGQCGGRRSSIWLPRGRPADRSCWARATSAARTTAHAWASASEAAAPLRVRRRGAVRPLGGRRWASAWSGRAQLYGERNGQREQPLACVGATECLATPKVADLPRAAICWATGPGTATVVQRALELVAAVEAPLPETPWFRSSLRLHQPRPGQ